VQLLLEVAPLYTSTVPGGQAMGLCNPVLLQKLPLGQIKQSSLSLEAGLNVPVGHNRHLKEAKFML
jgi:hypothetical protein